MLPGKSKKGLKLTSFINSESKIQVPGFKVRL